MRFLILAANISFVKLAKEWVVVITIKIEKFCWVSANGGKGKIKWQVVRELIGQKGPKVHRELRSGDDWTFSITRFMLGLALRKRPQ